MFIEQPLFVGFKKKIKSMRLLNLAMIVPPITKSTKRGSGAKKNFLSC